MMVITDFSEAGTFFTDDDSVRHGKQIQVKQKHLCAEGLRTVNIGSYKFRIELPRLEAEKAEARRWFFEHEPEPVTEAMLRAQLGPNPTKIQETRQIGQGGGGKVYRIVEKNTGLLFALKKLPECANKLAEREVKLMKRVKDLQSPLLAQYFHSKLSSGNPTLEWWMYMPLYQGNLTDALPQPLEVLERVMLRMMEAVSTLHKNGALHQDIKPDNFFVLRKRPLEIVLGDFGHTVSLQNHAELVGDCGTDGFAAPERFLQRHETALDVYSLGVSFFVMLEFERLRPVEWKKRLERLAEQPSSFYGHLIIRMTAWEPERRPNLQQCMEVVRRKDRSGASWPKFPEARPVQLGDIGRKRSPEKTNTSPVVAATCLKKRVDQPAGNLITHNIFAHLAEDTRTHPRVPVVDAPRANTNLPNRGLNRPAKAATHHNTVAHLRTESSFNPSVAYIEGQKRKEKATNRHHIFAHLNTNATTPPHVPVPHRPEQGEKVLGAQAQQASDLITRPKPNEDRRMGTRDQLRRSPTRQANISRAFAICKRGTRIRDTTTNMAKCLYYLGAGAMTNTRDIALIGVDAFRFLKDVWHARQAIKHMQPEASIRLGDATWLAAGMKSKGWGVVTPAEYEEERMRSTQREIENC